ncbi:alpha/beta hydrolase [Streptomyces sp. A3M-1-3]|uniref:alpha/beta hydrolase n=1 Tax=Streptomyces sp. A3M-1-3 TaxID=2962044 RepID=UPI0020B652BF|nr:alpha/beta hydrolase [Streptomyces sp. A3M-1-3]MCP3821571.1 alpha/beta hydrolase [Streptomyces sp. A3M-1-3]
MPTSTTPCTATLRATTLRAAALAAAVALLALTGCSDDSGNGQDLGKQQLDWQDCPAPSTAEGGGPAPSPLPGGAEWQCATVAVPRDYAEPDGETVDIALIRGQARDQDRRIGSLIYNFGGPGSSGIATLPAAAKDYERLRERYDLVSFDPRGVGRSAGVKCENDRQLDAYYAQDATPDDATEEKILTDHIKTYAASCEKNSGAVLPYVGTLNAARDLDLMRQVLGDDKLYYFGFSYGTELGGVYAHLFPKKVGRAVFDAVVDPTKDSEQGSLGQAKGFQLALDGFAQDCVDRGDECQLPGSTAKEIEENIVEFLQQLEKKPITGIGERELTQSAATNGIAQALYSKEYWPLLEQGLDEADGGNGQLLLALSDALNGRNQDGTYSNLGAANTAINCVDSKDRYTLAETKAKLPVFRAASPVFGDWLGWSMLSCTNWPVPGTWEHPDVSAPGAAPILLIGTTGDPATPYEGTRKMADALGKGVGVEVTYRGEGHGAYNGGNRCVQAAVDGYLLRGRVPAAGTVCE